MSGNVDVALDEDDRIADLRLLPGGGYTGCGEDNQRPQNRVHNNPLSDRLRPGERTRGRSDGGPRVTPRSLTC